MHHPLVLLIFVIQRSIKNLPLNFEKKKKKPLLRCLGALAMFTPFMLTRIYLFLSSASVVSLIVLLFSSPHLLVNSFYCFAAFSNQKVPKPWVFSCPKCHPFTTIIQALELIYYSYPSNLKIMLNLSLQTPHCHCQNTYFNHTS